MTVLGTFEDGRKVGRLEGLLEAVKVCKQHGAYFHQKSEAGIEQENKFHEIVFGGSEGGALACGETILALVEASKKATPAHQDTTPDPSKEA